MNEKKLVKGGYPFYGQAVGVLVFDQKGPRVPGDPGNNLTFPYPVCYEVVDGKFSDLIKGSEEIKAKLVKSVNNLKNRGVKGIVGDCGLMALYQTEMAGETGMVVFSSAIIMIPLVWQLIGKSGSVGILTGHSDLLSKNHLLAAGWNEDIRITIQGMQDEPHFSDVVINGKPELDCELMRRDVINGARKLLKDSDVRAIIIECSNLATFSADVYEEFGVPVFDAVTGTNIIKNCVMPSSYL